MRFVLKDLICQSCLFILWHFRAQCLLDSQSKQRKNKEYHASTVPNSPKSKHWYVTWPFRTLLFKFSDQFYKNSTSNAKIQHSRKLELSQISNIMIDNSEESGKKRCQLTTEAKLGFENTWKKIKIPLKMYLKISENRTRIPIQSLKQLSHSEKNV